MPIAAQTAAASSPYRGRRRTLLSASTTMTSGGTNGSSVTTNGRGSPSGPSHHVATPSSRLAFQTPLQATKARTHTAAVAIRHSGVCWPGRGPRARGGASGGGGGGGAGAVVSTLGDGTRTPAGAAGGAPAG